MSPNDKILFLTTIVITSLILSAVIIAGVLLVQRILDSEQVYKILHEGSQTEKFTRLALLAIVILLAFIAFLLYDRLVLLPQRVVRAAQEAKEAAQKAEEARWEAGKASRDASKAESDALHALIEQAKESVKAHCEKYPSDVATCGPPARKQNKPSSEKAEHDIGVYRDEHGTLHFYDTTAKKNLKEADGQ